MASMPESLATRPPSPEPEEEEMADAATVDDSEEVGLLEKG